MLNFIDQCIMENTPVTVFLANGIKLEGHITGWEEHPVMKGILLTRGPATQLINIGAISTIMPALSFPKVAA